MIKGRYLPLISFPVAIKLYELTLCANIIQTMNNCDMLTESFPNDCSYQNILCKRGDVVLVYTIIL